MGSMLAGGQDVGMGPAARRGAHLYIWSGYGRGDRAARRGAAVGRPHSPMPCLDPSRTLCIWALARTPSPTPFPCPLYR